jgi:hypothetical protein
LFEHVTTQYKGVGYTFCCDVLLKIEYGRQSGRNSRYAVTAGIRDSARFILFVPWVRFNFSGLSFFSFAERVVSVIVYRGMLMESS